MSGKEEPLQLYKWLLDQKVTELHVLYNMGTIVGESLRKAEMFEKLWAFLKESMSISAVSIYELDEDGKRLCPVFSTSTKQARKCVPLGEGAVGAVATTGRPLLLPDASAYDGFLYHAGEKRAKGTSFLSVPLKAKEDVKGVLAVEKKGKKFKGDDVDLVVMLGLLVAIGLEKCALFEKTEEMSQRDGLTGLLNRRVFMEKLKDEVERARRTKRPISFIMMDIDNFKHINDTYGHKAGDTFLTEIASVITSSIRTGPTDILARYGGEEFSLILVETDMEGAQLVAERIRTSVKKHKFSLVKANRRERPTISLGVATAYYKEDCESELVTGADKALYHAKKKGKDKTGYVDGKRLYIVGSE